MFKYILMSLKSWIYAIRQIRKFNPDLKIIAQTVFALIGDREKAIETGCKEFIEKHGSSIWVESEKGKDQHFILLFRVVKNRLCELLYKISVLLLVRSQTF